MMKMLIGIITFLVLSSVVAVIMVGTQSFDGIVTEKPYEKGLSWDKIRNDKLALGWNLVLKEQQLVVGTNNLSFTITDRERAPLRDADLSLVLSRPSTSAYDKAFLASSVGQGLYSASVVLPFYGYWDLRVTVKYLGNSVTFEKRIFAEKERRKT